MTQTEQPRHTYEVTVLRDVRIPTADGSMTLSGDVYLPIDAGPVPALVAAMPYRRDASALSGGFTERWFASRGYAHLLIDFRGVGSSDGSQRAAFDESEVDDAVAAVDWASSQPWCDGTVGMWGHSYGALMAMRAAASGRADAVKAILAWEGPLDPGRDFVHPGGVRGALGPLGLWGPGTLFGQLLPPLDDFTDPAEQERWRARLAAEPYIIDMFRRGPDDPVWAARRVDTSAVAVPALCLAGWRDLFVESTVRGFEELRGPKWLIAGPWMHTSPQDAMLAPIDFFNLALQWWDHWLRGVDNGADRAPTVRLYVQGGDPRWLAFDAWDPGRSDEVHDLSVWQVTAPAEPTAVVGAYSGLWAFPGAFGTPLDQHDDDARSLAYTSAPLDRPVLISGRPRVSLDEPWPVVCVKLCDVDEAGRSTLICAGLQAVPQGVERLDIALAPTTYEIEPGHRLRVTVAPGDFPRVWPIAATGWPTATSLALPVPGDGRPIEMPDPDPDDMAAAMELIGELTAGLESTVRPVWTVTVDHIFDVVSIRLGAEGYAASRPPHRKHVMRSTQDATITASRNDPASATIVGSMSATVDTETGQHITADLSFTVTATSLDATGRVAMDDEVLLDHRWQA
jgi:predicted acyl esterase